MKFHKDVRPLVKQLKALGFIIEPGGKHALIKNIEGKVVGTLPITPSDHRTIKNTTSDLRRAGVLPPKNKHRPRRRAWVNEERAKLDLEPLAALPKGEPRNPWCCPLAVCFDKENRGTATLVSGTVIDPVIGSVEDYDEALIRITHPQFVQEFVRAFDHGEIPELVVAGYDWDKGYVE